MPYMIDIEWFDYIHCRSPYYECINFREFFILNDKGEVIDSIRFYPDETNDGRFYRVDKERYEKIKKYYRGKDKI